MALKEAGRDGRSDPCAAGLPAVDVPLPLEVVEQR